MFKGKKCARCEGKIKDSFEFCPYCGLDLANPEKDMEDFGMLGKSNKTQGYPLVGGMGGMGITDKMFDSLFKSLMRNLEKQMKNVEPEVQSFPNGIKIRLGNNPVQKKPKKSKKSITQEQINKMSGLPRVEAKANVRRLSDKVVYDIAAQGIEHVEDVFVSKLETGYEVKAIGKKKVYVNNIPVNLPLKGYSVSDKGLQIEFAIN